MHILPYIFIYPKLHNEFLYVGFAFYLIQILSHFFAAILNPGIPHRKNQLKDEIIKKINLLKRLLLNQENFQNRLDRTIAHVCLTCNIIENSKYKPIKHCNYCGICVKGKI